MTEHWECPVRCPGCGEPAPYDRAEWKDVSMPDMTTVNCPACSATYRIRPVFRYIVDRLDGKNRKTPNQER